jgi:hypothetical protein
MQLSPLFVAFNARRNGNQVRRKRIGEEAFRRDVAHSCNRLITVGADFLRHRAEGDHDATECHSFSTLPFAQSPIQIPGR